MNQSALREKNVTLLDLLDRMLDKGVVLTGDITISVANIDLVYVGLKVLLSSVETMEQLREGVCQPPLPPLTKGGRRGGAVESRL